MADDVVDIEEIFTAATKHVRHISSQLSSDKLLYFYSRFKQVTEGQCRTPKPSFFDFQGKAKWEAWKKLGDISKTQAMMEYVSLLSNIDEKWMDRLEAAQSQDNVENYSKRQPGQRGLGISVSVMANTDAELSDVNKTVFDWCQEGNVDRVRQLLISNAVDVNSLDQQGLGLLHWSCDRGDLEMTKMLLSFGADINRQARDFQTALHYAASCDHKDITELLFRQGVDHTLKDDEGNTAMDVASDDMKLILQGQIKLRT